ncbi:hypothetical protein TNCV_133801 [Trichonephila clavipes]|nr:hypothetical protein TNCV_133801 [Trichonephila clavipes]
MNRREHCLLPGEVIFIRRRMQCHLVQAECEFPNRNSNWDHIFKAAETTFQCAKRHTLQNNRHHMGKEEKALLYGDFVYPMEKLGMHAFNTGTSTQAKTIFKKEKKRRRQTPNVSTCTRKKKMAQSNGKSSRIVKDVTNSKRPAVLVHPK